MNQISRQCGTAGHFFPKETDELTATLQRFHQEAKHHVSPKISPAAAIIAPHAGYRFSGEMAMRAWIAAKTKNAKISKIFILSPAHKKRFSGIALSSADFYETPMGKIQIDKTAQSQLLAAKIAKIEEDAFDMEHGIETQIPFAQYLFPKAQIIPMVFGQGTQKEAAKAIALAMSENPQNTLTVISSDLSHFLDHERALQRDLKTASFIECFLAKNITTEEACGWRPLGGFLQYAKETALRPQRLGLVNSASHSKDYSRVVGYGAWSFAHKKHAAIPDEDRLKALKLARAALKYKAQKGRDPGIDIGHFSPLLQGWAASFVTLTKEDRLRGCIGSILPRQALIADIGQNAVSAGFSDKRFNPVKLEEINEISIGISVLSPNAPLEFTDKNDLLEKIVPQKDGLVLSGHGRRGVFLPKVWESLKEPEQFLNALVIKAGFEKGFWSPQIKIERFWAENFSE